MTLGLLITALVGSIWSKEEKLAQTAAQTYIQEYATARFSELLFKAGLTSSVGSDHIVQVKDYRVLVLPVIEEECRRDGKWFKGIRFDIQLNGSPAPALTSGSVGIGDTERESQEDAAQDWLELFGRPFAAFLAWPRTTESDYMASFPSATEIRGEPPGEWVDGTRKMHDIIVGAMTADFAEDKRATQLCSAYILVVTGADGKIKVEARKNGRLSPELTRSLAALPWPKVKAYMFKQFYILVPPALQRLTG